MLKKAAFSPAQPRRAKTRRSAGKAATPQLTLVSRFTLLWNDARTPLADFFSILLGCADQRGNKRLQGPDDKIRSLLFVQEGHSRSLFRGIAQPSRIDVRLPLCDGPATLTVWLRCHHPIRLPTPTLCAAPCWRYTRDSSLSIAR